MEHQALAELLFPAVTDTLTDLEERFPPRALPEGAAVTRMAPSPTGFMHLGNLFGALTDYLLALQSKGVFMLRIEDTDQKREVPGGVAAILDVFDRYEMPFTEGATLDGDNGAYGPYRQRQRAAIYHVCAKYLVERGLAYPCFCTEEELAELRQRQEQDKEPTLGYHGKYAVCRTLTLEQIRERLDKGLPYVLRFRSAGNGENRKKVTDLVKGVLEFPENVLDVVLLKADGIPTYHFAHVVDDHFMRTTHVVRGEEWIATLPIHVQLFDAMGWKPPKYVHTAQLMKLENGNKRKLSKRKDPELALSFYQEEGFPVDSLKEYLLTLLNSDFEDWRRANQTESLEKFPFKTKKMSVSGALFDLDKLLDVSKNVIARMDGKTVCKLLCAWAKDYDAPFYQLLSQDEAYAEAVLSIGRGGKKPRKDYGTWKEAKEAISFFYRELYVPAENVAGELPDADAKAILQQVLEFFESCTDNNDFFGKLKSAGEALGYTGDMKAYKAEPSSFKGNVAQVSNTVRLALTGRTNSPDLFLVTEILGSEETRRRLTQALETL